MPARSEPRVQYGAQPFRDGWIAVNTRSIEGKFTTTYITPEEAIQFARLLLGALPPNLG